MNLKKKMKAFFTMNRHANDGFTLVELIVVIAILAILAGVAVPAYSGYIEKANRAADEQLLSVVNTAFAAACAINGESNYFRNDVSASIVNKQFVYVEPFKTDFTSFFEDDAMEFNVISSLLYDAEFGGFKDPATATNLTLSYGGGFVHVTGEAINAMLNSTYYADGMGSEKLMNEVDRVAYVAGVIAGGSIANVQATEGFADATLAALGIDGTGKTLDEKQEMMIQKATEMAMKELGITELTENNQDQVKAKAKEIQDNALVLYTAKNTYSLTVDEAKALLDDVNSTMIKDAMDGKLPDVDPATGMTQAALAYGMYYAYVNSDECTNQALKDQANSADGILAMDVINALNSSQEFRDYIAGDQGTKDMNAYLQAMSVINSSSGDSSAVETLLSEGFASDDMINILIQTMGK